MRYEACPIRHALSTLSRNVRPFGLNIRYTQVPYISEHNGVFRRPRKLEARVGLKYHWYVSATRSLLRCCGITLTHIITVALLHNRAKGDDWPMSCVLCDVIWWYTWDLVHGARVPVPLCLSLGGGRVSFQAPHFPRPLCFDILIVVSHQRLTMFLDICVPSSLCLCLCLLCGAVRRTWLHWAHLLPSRVRVWIGGRLLLRGTYCSIV